MTTAQTRLGVIGGTFDPIHVGHLDAADAARAALTLDEVLVVPTRQPPHRPAEPRASMFHRFALAALALVDREGYCLSDMELQRSGPSYTSGTLRDLHARGWRPAQIFFIIGADAFAEIASWHEYPAILDACHFAVIARPGISPDEAIFRNPLHAARVRQVADAAGDLATTAIFPVAAHTSTVSSSAIRARLAAGQSIEGMVPVAVAWHIHHHHLYTVPSREVPSREVPSREVPSREALSREASTGEAFLTETSSTER